MVDRTGLAIVGVALLLIVGTYFLIFGVPDLPDLNSPARIEFSVETQAVVKSSPIKSSPVERPEAGIELRELFEILEKAKETKGLTELQSQLRWEDIEERFIGERLYGEAKVRTVKKAKLGRDRISMTVEAVDPFLLSNGRKAILQPTAFLEFPAHLERSLAKRKKGDSIRIECTIESFAFHDVWAEDCELSQ